MTEREIPRRDVLKGITLLCASGAIGISGLGLWTDTTEAAHAEAPHNEEEILSAFAETVIPGPDLDPERSVGAIEARALEVLYDPYYGLSPLIPMLTRNLSRTSLWWYGKPFVDLDLSQRTEILQFKDKNSLVKPVYENAEILVKLAFYGGIINDVGTDYISFPGPSFGYRDYCFNRRFADEETEDGNLP